MNSFFVGFATSVDIAIDHPASRSHTSTNLDHWTLTLIMLYVSIVDLTEQGSFESA